MYIILAAIGSQWRIIIRLFLLNYFFKSSIIILENRGEFMYTMYIAFIIVLAVSFITGCIIQWWEHKQKNKIKNEGNT